MDEASANIGLRRQVAGVVSTLWPDRVGYVVGDRHPVLLPQPALSDVGTVGVIPVFRENGRVSGGAPALPSGHDRRLLTGVRVADPGRLISGPNHTQAPRSD